jgi:methyl-accepting chemotaxis protein
MTPSEYQQLADFFVDRLGRLQAETRTFVQVSVESLRDEIRVVADGVLTNGLRIEENGRRIEENGRRIEENGLRIEENGRRIEDNTRRIEENGRRIDEVSTRLESLTDRVDRLGSAVTAGFADHNARIRALE